MIIKLAAFGMNNMTHLDAVTKVLGLGSKGAIGKLPQAANRAILPMGDKLDAVIMRGITKTAIELKREHIVKDLKQFKTIRRAVDELIEDDTKVLSTNK